MWPTAALAAMLFLAEASPIVTLSKFEGSGHGASIAIAEMGQPNLIPSKIHDAEEFRPLVIHKRVGIGQPSESPYYMGFGLKPPQIFSGQRVGPYRGLGLVWIHNKGWNGLAARVQYFKLRMATLWNGSDVQLPQTLSVHRGGLPGIDKLDYDSQLSIGFPKCLGRGRCNVGSKFTPAIISLMFDEGAGRSPQQRSKYEQGDRRSGQHPSGKNKSPFLRRLAILWTVPFAGWFISAFGWQNLYEKRRALGAAQVCLGTIMIAVGIGLFAATQFRSTWDWWL